MSPAPRWYLGFFLSLLNCALSSTGVTLQRKAHLLSAAAPVGDEGGEQRMSRVHAAMLYCGIVIYILAAVPGVYSYTVAPQIVPTAVACFRLVVITALAHCFLEERVKTREVLGMLACIAGTFLCLYFGPHSHSRTNEPLERRALPLAMVVYLCVGLTTLCVLLVVEHAACLLRYPAGRANRAGAENPGFSYTALPLATGLAFALEKVFNTEMGHLDGPSSPGEFMGGIPRASPAWWCAVIGVVTLGLTDFYLNLQAAKKIPLQIFQPCAFALGTSLQYAQSIAIFGEFASLSPVRRVLSVGGALLSLAGALYIRPPKLPCSAPEVAPACEEPAARSRSSSSSSSNSTSMELLGDGDGPVDHIEIVPTHAKAAIANAGRSANGTTNSGDSLKTPLR